MRWHMKHNEVKNEELQYLKTNCNKCALKKRDLCPYLEEVATCNMFNDLKGKRYSRTSMKETVSTIGY
jgi:hypothetical protein